MQIRLIALVSSEDYTLRAVGATVSFGQESKVVNVL